MKCSEVRNLARLYLDSELEPKSSLEIEQHLQSCRECAGLYEAEQKFDERLFGVLRRGRKTPALWEEVESRMQPAHRRKTALFRRWKVLALGGSAALFIAVLIGSRILFTSPTLDLAEIVEKDHREFVEGKMMPEFAGALPDDVAGHLGGRLDAAAFTKVPARAGFRSEGSRLCHLHGVPVAWTLGRCDGVPVSLIVFKRSELEHFPKTQQRLATGEPIVCTRTGRFQFAVRFAGNHVVCAIADTSKQRLEDLLKSVRGAG